MQEPDNCAINGRGYEYDTLMSMLHVSVSKHLLDEHFTLVWANDVYYNYIGYTKEEYEEIYHNQCDSYYVNEALGIHDKELWDQLSQVVVNALATGQNGYTLVTRIRKRNGDYLWTKLTATFVEEYINGYQVSYTTMSDITDIMEVQMEQSITYDNMPGFVAKYRVGKNCEFILLDANEKFKEFFDDGGWKIATGTVMSQEFQNKFMNGEPIHYTCRMVDPQKNNAWLQLNASCIGYQDGDPVYLVVYIDVTQETELRQMQERLEAQAEKLRSALRLAEEASRAKSDFFSRMSHDIRTPMNAILGMRDIADAHLDNPEKVHDCLKKIALSGQYLLELINNVLDMSKIESGEMALRDDSVSLPEVLENIVAIMQPQIKQRKQNFSIHTRGVVHEQLVSDALRLRQIFLNILSNSSKFTPEGGSITMEVREMESNGETALFGFTITDTGVGMHPDFVAHIFDAFSREKDSRVDKIEGTGLGMAITKKIVELFGGIITVDSAPGAGTAFHIQLPMRIENLAPMEQVLPDLRIIVVDDDAAMCEYTTEMLDRLGVHADYVAGGKAAVQKIAQSLQHGEGYDAVILDWKMPDMDGIQTTEQIRSLCGQTLPVIIFSAYDWTDIEKDARNAGVTGFLPKPVFISTLCRGLQKYVLGKDSALEQFSQERQQNFAGEHFLLVEDNALNREVAAELLRYAGAVVDIACDGAEGVSVFQQSKENTFDLILMDVQMPVMNGYDATRHIRALPRKDAATVPILAMTADAFAEDIAAAKQAGMNGHLAKPLDQASLKREIRKYIK